MHVRVSAVTRNGKTHRYAQLVESYRRPADGLPAHRVLAHLGQLSEAEIENFKAALAGNRQGQRVAVVHARAPHPPKANLRYLDLAVLLALWREIGLGDLLAKLLPKGQAEAAPTDVVTALVVQRCVAPGSKLYAERWFPRTALPELLAIAPASFNNTRVHRVLDELDTATPALMARLPTLYLEHERRPAFATLYLDVTDAFFVGHGPEGLAVTGKTKEGLIQRKIGIVLLCNERGYPLRWRVIAGNTSDCVAMTEMFQAVAQTRWAQETPIVCDRAMGTTAQLREMAATGLRFLTSLKTTEFDSYAPKLPYATFAALDVAANATEEVQTRMNRQAGELAQAAGLEPVTDNLWLIDLGVIEFGASVDAALDSEPRRSGSTVVEALQLCRKIDEAVAAEQFSSFNAAGRAHGLPPGTTKKYRELGCLPQDVQEAMMAGEADACSLGELLRVARAPDAEQQRARFSALLEATSTRAARPSSAPVSPSNTPVPAALRVRVVGYFNPERFVEQRMNTNRRQAAITTFVSDLNQRLANPRARLNRAGVIAAVDRRLRRDDLLDAYDVHVAECDTGSRVHYQVSLAPVASEWRRRRRFHGFTVLVGHPDLPHSAADLCRSYRAKDLVEKDFQVIKSVVKLRPIRHHTEAKVNAHVTLCILALVLERHLGQRLDGRCSAESAIETLATCHLNQYEGKGARALPLYSLTKADDEQLVLLRKLRLPLLADNDDLAARITPRTSS
jgi:hypothetical protein